VRSGSNAPILLRKKRANAKAAKALSKESDGSVRCQSSHCICGASIIIKTSEVSEVSEFSEILPLDLKDFKGLSNI
jgi:hypothetical protein